jgi:AAA domain
MTLDYAGYYAPDDLADQQPPSLRNRLRTVEQLRRLPPPEPLVGGLLYRDTLAQLSGPPGSYKTFLVIGMACAVSAGVSWEGHHVPSPEPVLYIAAEGATGLARRIDAWCESNRASVGQLLVLPEPLQLGNRAKTCELAEIAAELRPGLIIFDTRARCTTGLDENSASEQGRAIEAADRLRRGCGATTLVVHHSGRHGEHGRGSTAWDGALWTSLLVTGSDLTARITVAKHKDAGDGQTYDYRLLRHVVSEDRMPNEPQTRRETLVAVQAGALDVPDSEPRSMRLVLDVLRTTAGPEGLTRSRIAEFAEPRGVSRSSAYAAVKTLVERGFIRNVGTENRGRYVPAGQVMLGQDDP